tara:strand:- start:3040 stop:3249 length:210 start_codon:yes stop_codon:yes gene_type:complete
MSGILNDSSYMITLISALVKREGGEIRMSEDDLAVVTLNDLVTLSYDMSTNEIVLRSTNVSQDTGSYEH